MGIRKEYKYGGGYDVHCEEKTKVQLVPATEEEKGHVRGIVSSPERRIKGRGV